MRPTSYHFRHQMTVPAPRERVHDLLVDVFGYVDWWPQVRAVGRLGPDDAVLVCRSVLPYDLELLVHAVSREPDRLEVDIDGPLSGWVRWSLQPAGPAGTLLRLEQQVQVEAWQLAVGSWVGRPLLRANHRWMMRGAERGLRERLGSGGCQDSAATAAS